MWDLRIRSLKSGLFAEEEKRKAGSAAAPPLLHHSGVLIRAQPASTPASLPDAAKAIGMDLDVDPTLVLLIVSSGLLSLAIVLWLLRSDGDQKSKIGQWWTNGSSSLSEKILRFPPKAESAWVCSCQVEIF